MITLTDSTPGQLVWDLWWMKEHWVRSFRIHVIKMTTLYSGLAQRYGQTSSPFGTMLNKTVSTIRSLIDSNLNVLWRNVISNVWRTATPITVFVAGFGNGVLLIVMKFQKIDLDLTENGGGISLLQGGDLGFRGPWFYRRSAKKLVV